MNCMVWDFFYIGDIIIVIVRKLQMIHKNAFFQCIICRVTKIQLFLHVKRQISLLLSS